MKFQSFNIESKNGKSNCVIRSICKVLDKEYDEVYNDLINIAKEYNLSFNDILVFEKYLNKNKFMKHDEYKNLMIKDLNLDGKNIIFCYDKKDTYHMVALIDNTLYDKSNFSLELYVISVYKKF